MTTPTDYPSSPKYQDSLPGETYQDYIKRTKPFFIKKSTQLLEEETLDTQEDINNDGGCKDGFCSL